MTHALDIARPIARRIVISGALVLETPAHFSNGDSEAFTDLPLLLEEVSGRALLPGTSLAGALRAWLKRRTQAGGSSAAAERLKAATLCLFGGEKAQEGGDQSTLIVDDALGPLPQIDLRDGVAIDPRTRTAADEAKFDYQVLQPGTSFDLRLELLLPDADAADARHALASALAALGTGEIRLGMRKQRGFGRCRVTEWQVTTYDMRQPAGLLAWLAADHPGWGPAPAVQTGPDVEALLAPDGTLPMPVSQELKVRATFALESSLLVRAGFGSQDAGPDVVHLHATSAKDPALRVPVLPGTSVAGALRARTRRILATVWAKEGATAPADRIDKFVDGLFGPKLDPKRRGDTQTAWASRIRVDETEIEHGRSLVQNRIRIDRFTGGAYESALFNEQPVFGQPETRVEVRLTVGGARGPSAAEIGLVLLLLKDLWTGDLPLGGESSVGRGRLRGLEAEIDYAGQHWRLAQPSAAAPLSVTGDPAALNRYVSALHEEASR